MFRHRGAGVTICPYGDSNGHKDIIYHIDKNLMYQLVQKGSRRNYATSIKKGGGV